MDDYYYIIYKKRSGYGNYFYWPSVFKRGEEPRETSLGYYPNAITKGDLYSTKFLAKRWAKKGVRELNRQKAKDPKLNENGIVFDSREKG
jgi:hypothetical protein